MSNHQILVICGPTATGKTELGVKLAKSLAGEIISADSRQVYQYLDISTGKDLPEKAKFKIVDSRLQVPGFVLGYYLFEKIPVWLLDVVKPNHEFSVAQYTELAWRAIRDVWQRKKLPILIGGTGFYIKAIIDGMETLGIPPDWGLRWRLKNLSVQKLFIILSQFDPKKAASMNISDRKNPRRLIRAIEIAQNQPTLKSRTQTSDCRPNPLFIGLTTPYPYIYQRIDQRVGKRVKRGAKKEVKRLLRMGYSWENSVLGVTIGYREWQPFFEKKVSLEKVIESWKFAEHTLARRQMTWFKKDKRIHWFDISQKNWQDKVERLIENWDERN